MKIDVGDVPQRFGGHQRIDVGLDQPAGIGLLLAQLLLNLLLLGAVARGGQDAERRAARVGEYARVEAHHNAPPVPGDEHQLIPDHAACLHGLLHPGAGPLRLREVVGEARVDQMLARVAREARGLRVHVRDHPVRRDREQRVGRGLDERAVVGLLFRQLPREAGLLGDVAGAGKDPLHAVVGAAEHRGVEGHRGLAPRLGLEHQLVVGDHACGEGLLHAGVGPRRLREVPLEGRADQFFPVKARHAAHLLVHIRDEPFRVHRDEAVHRGLDQPAQVGLLLAELLLELLLLGDVARGGEHALELARSIAEGGGVVGDHRHPPIL